MNNTNPLYLMEGKYLNKTLTRLGIFEPDRVKKVVKKDIFKKGSKIRNNLAKSVKKGNKGMSKRYVTGLSDKESKMYAALYNMNGKVN